MLRQETSRRTGTSEAGPSAQDGLAAAVVVALGMACCLAGPTLLAVLGSAALGSLIGWTGGVAALLAGVAVLVGTRRVRHRDPRALTSEEAVR